MDFSLLRFTKELRQQLAGDKRKLGFFLGAGSSMAAGLPGIVELTNRVRTKLTKDKSQLVDGIINNLDSDSSIEHVLNRVRTIRELIGKRAKYECEGIVGHASCAQLDRAICNIIANEIKQPPSKGYDTHNRFCQWLQHAQAFRPNSIEVFTTNYDVILETVFENLRIPYFDGFIGSVEPFFMSEAVNSTGHKEFSPPPSWIKLWKLHGSINWYWQVKEDGRSIFTRRSSSGSEKTSESETSGDGTENEELMIFPSKDKYIESRRLPFISYQDRLREFLSKGETLLLICGYSFQDDHLNEILVEALRVNKRLSITALMYGDFVNSTEIRKVNPNILDYAVKHPSFSVAGPDKVCIGGLVYEWEKQNSDKLLWDAVNSQCNLGDFNSFVQHITEHYPKPEDFSPALTDAFSGSSKKNLLKSNRPIATSNTPDIQ